MDGDRFDEIVRFVIGASSRRGVVRGGLTVAGASALAALGLSDPDGAEAKKKKKKKKIELCHNGQTISVSKKAKKAHLKHGDTIGPCPPPVPPPPPPPVTTTPPPLCPGQTECVGECCDQCCPPLAETTNEGQCATSEDVCCTVEEGGSFCPDKCCPISVQDPVGTCVGATDICCDGGGSCLEDETCCEFGDCEEPGGICCTEEQGGGACPAGLTQCCTEAEGFACCAVGETCCPDDTGCVVAGETCIPFIEGSDGGCCGVAAPRSAPQQNGLRRSRMTAAAHGGGKGKASRKRR